MRYPPRHKLDTRDRIVAAASRGFRTRGLAGTSVAAVMAEAGLTHGGFYAHFADKDALAAAACQRALADAWADVERDPDAQPHQTRQRLIDRYLAATHRHRLADGCVLAALGPEIARGAPAVRRALAEDIETHLARLAAVMPGDTPQQRRDEAGVLVSTLVGAVILSRLLPERAGRRHLAATRTVVHRAWPSTDPEPAAPKRYRPRTSTSRTTHRS